MTMAEYDQLMGMQQKVWNELLWGDGYDAAANYTTTGVGYHTESSGLITIALEMADEKLSLAERMYNLGFLGTQNGWESQAVVAMIAEFKDQGVPWDTINQAMIDYGLSDSTVYKKIYGEYTGAGTITEIPTWAEFEKAMLLSGVDSRNVKSIEAFYSSDVISYSDFLNLLYGMGLDSETIMQIQAAVDPSSRWTDLEIPVDTSGIPDFIPIGQPIGGRATGGPVAANTPYIVGEIGPELFVPQESGHILSNANMKKLLGMGVQGFADGTTDPAPFSDEWYAKYFPWQSDPDYEEPSTGSSTSTTQTLEEWFAAYTKELAKMLGTTSELGDALETINDYYTEQTKTATELGATSEQLAQMEIDHAAAKEKAIKDWMQTEIDYYNQMMGLNSELGDSLAAIDEHYAAAIASAKAAGLDTADLEASALNVKKKAIEDWLKTEIDYYNQMMGLNTDLGDSLAAIDKHYADAIASAKAAGASEAELAAIAQIAIAVKKKAEEDYWKDALAYYNDMMDLTDPLQAKLDAANAAFDKYAQAAQGNADALAAIEKARGEVLDKIFKDFIVSLVKPFTDIMTSLLEWRNSSVLGMGASGQALQTFRYETKTEFPPANNTQLASALKDKTNEDMQIYLNSLSKYAVSVTNALEATYDALVKTKVAISASIENIKLGALDDVETRKYYADKLSEINVQGWKTVFDNSDIEKRAQMLDDAHTVIMDYHNSEMTALEAKHTTEINNISAIREKLKSLVYSAFNIALPTAKQDVAADDYKKMYEAAKTGDSGAVSDYLSFVDTYLQTSQDKYKSSDEYLKIYKQVTDDISKLDTNPTKTLEELTQTQTDAIKQLNKEVVAALNELATGKAGDVIRRDVEYTKDSIWKESDVSGVLAIIYNQLSAIEVAANKAMNKAVTSTVTSTDIFTKEQYNKFIANPADTSKNGILDDGFLTISELLVFGFAGLLIELQAIKGFWGSTTVTVTGSLTTTIAFSPSDDVTKSILKWLTESQAGLLKMNAYFTAIKNVDDVNSEALLTWIDKYSASGGIPINILFTAVKNVANVNSEALLTWIDKYSASGGVPINILFTAVKNVANVNSEALLTWIDKYSASGGVPINILFTAVKNVANVNSEALLTWIDKYSASGGIPINILFTAIKNVDDVNSEALLTWIDKYSASGGVPINVTFSAIITGQTTAITNWMKGGTLKLGDIETKLVFGTSGGAAGLTAQQVTAILSSGYNVYGDTSDAGALLSIMELMLFYYSAFTQFLWTIADNSIQLCRYFNCGPMRHYADGGIASGPLSGYSATLHGTEAVIPLKNGSVPVQLSSGNAAGGYNDPETKSLLRELVAQGRQKQRVTLALDNGKELSGYIRSEADTVRVSANERKGVSRRRLYN
jgi:phage host-nuclease inhibitor protein Gam